MAAPPAETSGEEMTRGELRQFLKTYLGMDLPVTIEDLYDVASALKILDTQLAGSEKLPFVGTIISKLRGAVVNTLVRYGQEYFGNQGPQLQSAYTIFSELLRPPQPTIEKRQTAEEFLSDFNQGFRQTVEEMRAAGKISGREAEFAYNILRPQYLNRYLAELGKFAEAGASPFALKEVTREERGVAPGTTAGEALTAALGEGVKEPTRIREEISATAAPGATGAATASAQVTRRATELQEQVENIGRGVPREFIALPRIMPMDFLKNLTAEEIKLAYAGSAEGGGRGTTPAPAGFASSVRRV
jgi:hypothetical protein